MFSTTKSHEFDNLGYAETNKKVHLPIIIPFDVLFGGACRDVLVEDTPSDYDMICFNKTTYIQAIHKLKELDFKMASTNHISNDPFPVGCVLSSWKVGKSILYREKNHKRRQKFKRMTYDLFFIDGTLKDALNIISKADITVNTCFQTMGKIHVQIDKIRHYFNKEIYPWHNFDKNRVLSICKNLKHKKGWKFTDEFLDYIVGGCKIQTGYGCTPLWDTFRRMYPLFRFLSDEEICHFMLSKDENILSYTRREINKRSRKNRLKSLTKKLLGIKDA